MATMIRHSTQHAALCITNDWRSDGTFTVTLWSST